MPHHICLYWILHRISGFMIIIILATHTLFYYPCSIPSVFCSYLIIHEYFLFDITCLISTCPYLPMLTTRFSMHDYDSVLSIHMCLSLHAIWLCLTTRLGSSDSSGSSCPGPGAWSMSEPGTCRIPVADLRCAAVVWISSRPSEALSFQAPCAPLEFSFSKLVSAFYTVHSCTSLCILAFAPISDVIFL